MIGYNKEVIKDNNPFEVSNEKLFLITTALPLLNLMICSVKQLMYVMSAEKVKVHRIGVKSCYDQF